MSNRTILAAVALAGSFFTSGCEEMVALADGMIEGCSYTADFCGTAGGNTYSPPPVPYPTPRPQALTAPPPRPQQTQAFRLSAMANDCIFADIAKGQFQNRCSFPVNLEYCVLGANPNGFSSTMTCPNGGGTGIAANGYTGALIGGVTKVYYVACNKADDMRDVRWIDAQTGFTASCVQWIR